MLPSATMAARITNAFAPSEAGTSLVEVMVVMALLVLLLSGFAATARNMAPVHQWQASSREVATLLRAARVRAIASGRDVIVELAPNRVALRGDATLAVDLPASVTLSRFPARGMITFTPRGSCDTTGPLELSGGGPDHAGETTTITLVMATGRVRLER